MEVYRAPNMFIFTKEYIEALKQNNNLKAAQTRIAELEQQLADYHNTLESKLSKRNERIIDLEGQVKHWKSNHDNMVIKNAILRQRPDLPLDRISACTFIDDAKARITELEQQLADLQAKIDGGQRVYVYKVFDDIFEINQFTLPDICNATIILDDNNTNE